MLLMVCGRFWGTENVAEVYFAALVSLLQALRLVESQKLAAEREVLEASKREVEARVQALMGKEYGMVKVGITRPFYATLSVSQDI